MILIAAWTPMNLRFHMHTGMPFESLARIKGSDSDSENADSDSGMPASEDAAQPPVKFELQAPLFFCNNCSPLLLFENSKS